MPLVDSLLGAIVRLDGNALVMHVGEKPYVLTGSSALDRYRGPLAWGQVELATKRLTLEAVAGMLRQLLPPEEQQALSSFGAIEHQLDPNPKVPGRFTVIAARGGDDIWLEIRYHRPPEPRTEAEPAPPVARPEPAATAEPAQVLQREPSPPVAPAPEVPEAQPLTAPPGPAAPAAQAASVVGPERAVSEGEEEVAAPAAEPFIPDVGEAVAESPVEPSPQELEVPELTVPEAMGVEVPPPPAEPVWREPEVAEPTPAEPAAEELVAALAAEDVTTEPAVEEISPPFTAEEEPVEAAAPAWAAEPQAEPVWAELETVVPAAASEPTVEEEPVEPVVEEAVTTEMLRMEPEVAAAPDVDRAPLDRLLKLAAARGASALYIVAQAPPAIRVDGEISMLESEGPLASADIVAMLVPPAVVETSQAPPQGAEAEWVSDVPGVGRVRCLSFHDHRGPGGIFRMLPARALSVEQLGLSRVIQAFAAESEGLVLVTGPRASGKQTLITAFVDLINRTRADHVVTLESQILFVHQSRRSFVSQRELRGSAQEVAAEARAALRENPDVLVIEDLQSPELISLALQAAELGLLVFAAIPASGAQAAIERLIDQFPPEQRAQVQTTLAGALRGVVAQVLARKVGGGRLAAREVVLNTRAMGALISSGRTAELPRAIEDGRRLGMVPLNEALVEAVRAGVIDPSEAYRRAYDQEDLLARLRREAIDTSFVERLV